MSGRPSSKLKMAPKFMTSAVSGLRPDRFSVSTRRYLLPAFWISERPLLTSPGVMFGGVA
ncbi:hypothetical protein D3C83_136460 [compost metagenome]